MTASEKPHQSVGRRAEGEPLAEAVDPRSERTVPHVPSSEGDEGPSILGFPAEPMGADTAVSPGAGGSTAGVVLAPSSELLVFRRRAERLGGLLLVLAGVAAAISLMLPWFDGDGTTGSSLVHRALAFLGVGVGVLLRSTLWQPFVVVFGGYVLLALGLLLFVPARTHRVVGLLAFLVAASAAAGVLVPLADAGWSFGPFDRGMWFAAAVGVLGLLGALKAMLTGPRIAVRGPRASEDARP